MPCNSWGADTSRTELWPGSANSVVCCREQDSKERTKRRGLIKLAICGKPAGCSACSAGHRPGDAERSSSAPQCRSPADTYALNTKNGYEFAARKINEKGGVKIGGKSYKLVVRYYDDELMPARGTELAERLIKQEASNTSSGLTARA